MRSGLCISKRLTGHRGKRTRFDILRAVLEENGCMKGSEVKAGETREVGFDLG